MSSSTPPTHRPVRRQETGLFAVVLFLGILLTVFGGSVKLPKFEITHNKLNQSKFEFYSIESENFAYNFENYLNNEKEQ